LKENVRLKELAGLRTDHQLGLELVPKTLGKRTLCRVRIRKSSLTYPLSAWAPTWGSLTTRMISIFMLQPNT